MSMRVALLLAACVALAVAQPPQGPDQCDDEYECIYQAQTVDGITFSFDLRPLCAGGIAYNVNDSTGHIYNFNICGYAAFECEPTWNEVYKTGVAVQYFGDVPVCNTSAPACTDYNGDPVCCTQDCQVLGVGPPVWQLKQPNNPETGGVLVTHRGVPPAEDDPFWCPWDPKTQTQRSRTITFDFTCNYNMPVGTMNILGVYENSSFPCAYTIYLESFHGCGCSPDCANRNCGPDSCGGYCGSAGQMGFCPNGYFCNADQTCCKPDCSGRECGNDGCGGFCGTPNGQCGDYTEKCVRSQCVPTSPWPTPGPSIIHKPVNSPGALTGWFFFGIISAVGMGGIAFFIYKKRFESPYTPAGGGGGGGAPSATGSFASI